VKRGLRVPSPERLPIGPRVRRFTQYPADLTLDLLFGFEPVVELFAANPKASFYQANLRSLSACSPLRRLLRCEVQEGFFRDREVAKCNTARHWALYVIIEPGR
jgi:hypothetical protein